jgi:ADP-ribosylglycohydrolase
MQRERFVATLLGGALGDTLGMPVEGWCREQIQRYVGTIGEPIDPVIVRDATGKVVTQDEDGPLLSVSPHLSKGNWTDDTYLAVATARAIVEFNGLDLDALARQSVALYEACQQRAGNDDTIASFGRTTLAAFAQLKQGISPLASGVTGRFPGNGPALKMAPVGLYMQARGRLPWRNGCDGSWSTGMPTWKQHIRCSVQGGTIPLLCFSSNAIGMTPSLACWQP